MNFAQSTNDVYPTAIRLAILLSRGALQRALEQLAGDHDWHRNRGPKIDVCARHGRLALGY
ncbi:hypothetical protein [Mesorhizobium sp. M0579]|uniref:hypothetical protein n=1 Tax=Mesorhizobium sp. M0579 TaxID=2956962 RepID=UPI00333C25F3